jgi:hypothetical protein
VRTEGKLLSGIWGFANMRNWRVILVWALCVWNRGENSACQLELAICFSMIHTVGVGNGISSPRCLGKLAVSGTTGLSNTNQSATLLAPNGYGRSDCEVVGAIG